MGARISRDEIRRLVRELLRDAVAGTETAATAAPPNGVNGGEGGEGGDFGEVGGLSERVRASLAGGGAIEIALANDGDLNAFARQVALCALERDLLGAIASNRVRFRLAGGPGPVAAPVGSAAPAVPAAPVPSGGGGEAYHWEQGLLNETKVTEIARTHTRLLLGRRALLTPLAWDRARSLGLQVARTKS